MENEEDEENKINTFNMYDWFSYIDLYIQTTNEQWKDVWEINIHHFLSVLTYAKAKLKRQEEYLKQQNR